MKSLNTEHQDSVDTVAAYLRESKNHATAFWQRHNVTTLDVNMDREVFNFCYEFYKQGFSLEGLSFSGVGILDEETVLNDAALKKNKRKEFLDLWHY